MSCFPLGDRAPCILSLDVYLGKSWNRLFSIRLKKKKSCNNNQKLILPLESSWDCNSEKISWNVLLVLCARTFTAFNRTSLQHRFLYNPCPLVKRHMYLILNCDFPCKWSLTDLPSPILFPFVFTDSLLFWYSFYCHFHHWNCSEGKVPIFSTITCSQAY